MYQVPETARTAGRLCPLPGLDKSKGAQGSTLLTHPDWTPGRKVQKERPVGLAASRPPLSPPRPSRPGPPPADHRLRVPSPGPAAYLWLQPETLSRASASGCAVTSEPQAPAPDATSRLRPPPGRRHLLPRGAGASSGGRAPGAAPLPGVILRVAPVPGPRTSYQGREQEREGDRSHSLLALLDLQTRLQQPQSPRCGGLTLSGAPKPHSLFSF